MLYDEKNAPSLPVANTEHVSKGIQIIISTFKGQHWRVRTPIRVCQVVNVTCGSKDD